MDVGIDTLPAGLNLLSSSSAAARGHGVRGTRGRRGLETVLRAYTTHYRPHRGLALLTPDSTSADPPPSHGEIKRRDRLGGLIHEYHRAAA